MNDQFHTFMVHERAESPEVFVATLDGKPLVGVLGYRIESDMEGTPVVTLTFRANIGTGKLRESEPDKVAHMPDASQAGNA